MSKRAAATVEERFYVARPLPGKDFGIGTIEDPNGFVHPVTATSTVTWSFDAEPKLLEGATVELVGPMSEEQAQNTVDAIDVEKEVARKQRSLQVATEARETAALIVGPHEPVAEHLSCEQHDQRIEALALVIYQARGYSQATELPA